MAGKAGGEEAIEKRGVLLSVRLAERSGAIERRMQVRMHPLAWRRYGEHGTICTGRFVALALSLQEVGAEEEREEVHGIDREGALNRRLFARRVVARAAGDCFA